VPGEQLVLRLISDGRRVRVLQTKLRERLFDAADEGPRRLDIGFQGDSISARVAWFRKQDWWVAVEDLDTRYWNGFGFGDPFADYRALSLVVELNPPKTGVDRRVQGGFAEDERGRVFLIHRGKLGGGRKGIGKGFLGWYPADGCRLLSDGAVETEVLVAGCLDAEDLLGSLRSFVGLAHAYKEGERAPKASGFDSGSVYRPEFSDKTKYRHTEEEIEAEWRHGHVVDALQVGLKALGVVGRKDRARDLFVVESGVPTVLFEVKTSLDTQSVYTAVGQLYWNSEAATRKIAVLPRPVSSAAREQLRRLMIECVEYDWNEGKPNIVDLAGVLGPGD
jgi:hypothetical protein